MFSNQIINCSFSKWYPLFGHLSIESESIKLSDDFVDYLLCDGIVLPKSSEVDIYDLSSDIQNEWKDEDSDDSTDDNQKVFEFPELEHKIGDILEKYGSVFPKLNWSSCEDSQWISPTGTRCRLSQDIYLLLKSSDRIVHDLTQPFKYCSDVNEENVPKIEYQLVLKKWIDINPSMEFRCFIKDNNLIGISQRDVRSFYDHIGQQKDDIISDIKQFFDTNLKNKFFDSDFVIDIYRPFGGKVVLVDINPFGQTTDSLLFDWDQINNNETNDTNSDDERSLPQFRYITNQNGIQPQTYSLNSLPIEVNYGYNLEDVMNGSIIDR